MDRRSRIVHCATDSITDGDGDAITDTFTDGDGHAITDTFTDIWSSVRWE